MVRMNGRRCMVGMWNPHFPRTATMFLLNFGSSVLLLLYPCREAVAQRFVWGVGSDIKYVSLNIPSVSYTRADDYWTYSVSIGSGDEALRRSTYLWRWNYQMGMRSGKIEWLVGLSADMTKTVSVLIPYRNQSWFQFPGVQSYSDNQLSMLFSMSGFQGEGMLTYLFKRRARTPVLSILVNRCWYTYSTDFSDPFDHVSRGQGLRGILYRDEAYWSSGIGVGCQMNGFGRGVMRILLTAEVPIEESGRSWVRNFRFYGIRLISVISKRKGRYVDFRNER